MNSKLLINCIILCLLSTTSLWAQRKSVAGKVTDENGEGLPGASVVEKGTTNGTITDINGNYQLKAKEDTRLIFSFVGYISQEVTVSNQKVIDVRLLPDAKELSEVVVTALGVSREKRSLGYATQEVEGEEMNKVQTNNFVNSLSGRVAGVDIKRNNNMGGSTNVVIRGNTSLTGNNQALFVIDGVPVNNEITNTEGQSQAGAGYDYGNAASDINPDDIESINVLKGAAATALYGSRAANGVIMITTKKGNTAQGFSVDVSSGFTFGEVDRSTFPEYQTQYGAGYGPRYSGPGKRWYEGAFNQDGTKGLVVPMSEDASYGAKFDPKLMVYHWNAFDPALPTYRKTAPWVAAKNGPITFFETPMTWTNSMSVSSATEKSAYRIGYTNYNLKGILPNSSLKRNTINMSLSSYLTKKLKVSASVNYIKTNALGRNSTGYAGNYMSAFRQWWQTNVDLKEQQDAYFLTRRNITWNYASTYLKTLKPMYHDNPYWQRYENYQSDERDRMIGNVALDYKILDWLSVYGRASADIYNALEEERRNIGSIASTFGIGTGTAEDGSLGRADAGSGYLRRDIKYSEYNFDLWLNVNKNLTEDLNLTALLGYNARRTNYNRIISSTNGGLKVPGLFSLLNSVGPLPFPKELDSRVGVDGYYVNTSLGYQGMLFLDGSFRLDHSSTLPIGNNWYSYPSVSTSFVFSELLDDMLWLSFGKVRLNWAQVGNSAQFNELKDTYTTNFPFNAPSNSVSSTKKNLTLKPEITTSMEAGLEMMFFERRLGFDFAVYKSNSVNQILPLRVSEATGYSFKMINAGEIENKGIELALKGTPYVSNHWKWDVHVNWTKNVNKVIRLNAGANNLQLGSFQGGVTINARVGHPMGVIFGRDYTYLNGQRLVELEKGKEGQYRRTKSVDNPIGDINPDWKAGVTNTLSYKNVSLSFLVDIQRGGDIFSLDMYYGLGTGLYKETAFINDLGNPVRNSIANGGGFINPGVNEDGKQNTTRIRADRFSAWGYARGLPSKAFIYDASFVKLRELSVTYRLPNVLLSKTPFKKVSLSFVGSNLWIIHKNLPYADPESGLGAGNLQGYSSGSLPTTRNFGFNVKLQF